MLRTCFLYDTVFTSRGISSNGRAPALHAGGTGIDTQILHFFGNDNTYLVMLVWRYLTLVVVVLALTGCLFINTFLVLILS